MASQMVTILIGIAVLILISSAYCMTQIPVKESFANRQYSVSDLEINTCPTFAPEIQTAKGSTDCCQGDLLDGKCSGTTFCTKSPAYKDVPGCVDKWREHFQKKSNDLCPTSMKNYYEDITNPNAIKGCSAGPITKDGKAPAQAARPKCRIYASETDNRRKADSCFIERERLRIRCPVVNGNTPQAKVISLSRNNDVGFTCEYPFELGMPNMCYEKSFLYAFLDKNAPWWRSSSDKIRIDNQLCENYIAARQKARTEANRLQAEQKAREAAEAARRAAEQSRKRAEEALKRAREQGSRLQQRLDGLMRRCR